MRFWRIPGRVNGGVWWSNDRPPSHLLYLAAHGRHGVGQEPTRPLHVERRGGLVRDKDRISGHEHEVVFPISGVVVRLTGTGSIRDRGVQHVMGAEGLRAIDMGGVDRVDLTFEAAAGEGDVLAVVADCFIGNRL